MVQKPITRRKVLKSILGGSVVFSASAILPDKWVKPVVESGVLPLHAQVSATGTINGTIRLAVINNGSGVAYVSAGRKVSALPISVANQTIGLYPGGFVKDWWYGIASNEPSRLKVSRPKPVAPIRPASIDGNWPEYFNNPLQFTMTNALGQFQFIAAPGLYDISWLENGGHLFNQQVTAGQTLNVDLLTLPVS